MTHDDILCQSARQKGQVEYYPLCLIGGIPIQRRSRGLIWASTEYVRITHQIPLNIAGQSYNSSSPITVHHPTNSSPPIKQIIPITEEFLSKTHIRIRSRRLPSSQRSFPRWQPRITGVFRCGQVGPGALHPGARQESASRTKAKRRKTKKKSRIKSRPPRPLGFLFPFLFFFPSFLPPGVVANPPSEAYC